MRPSPTCWGQRVGCNVCKCLGVVVKHRSSQITRLTPTHLLRRISRCVLQHGRGGEPAGTKRRAGKGIPSGAQPGRVRVRHVAGRHGEGDGRAAPNAPKRVRDAGMSNKLGALLSMFFFFGCRVEKQGGLTLGSRKFSASSGKRRESFVRDLFYASRN